LTWFHGDPADPNPDIQRLFEVLPDAYQYVQKIVVTCEISKGVLTEVGIPGSKIVTIPLGVDLMNFFPANTEQREEARESLGIPEGTICIGSFQKDGIGWEDGLEPKLVKGPDVFLEVIANLSVQYKNLLILLTGPSRGYIKQGLDKLGVPYIHNFLSDYHQIVRYYHALDLYLVTSRAEGGPKALLESWATGIPVISTRVGMPADLIRQGENGMLAEVDDIDVLTNRVGELIENRLLHEKCSRNGLEQVKRYDWPFIAEHYYQQLYEPFLR
jgi:glycosyltransferase involved in cell wall biosynthesis